MPLRPDKVEEFRALYRDHFGVRLDDKQAHEIAERLVHFFHLLWYDTKHPTPHEERRNLREKVE